MHDNNPTTPITEMQTEVLQTEPIPQSKKPIILIAAGLVIAVLVGFGIAKIADHFSVKEVSALSPILVVAEECGVQSMVEIPEVEGVTYLQSRSGSEIEVTAQASSDAYHISKKSDTFWSFNIAAIPCPEKERPTLTGPSQEQIEEFIRNGGKVAAEWAEETKEWFKEHGPGIWQRTKDGGALLKNWIKEWADGAAIR